MRVFLSVGGALIVGGLIPGLRFLYLLLRGGGTGNVQSLILAAILSVVGIQVCLIGLMADLVAMNRKMLEQALYRVRRIELDWSSSDRADKGHG
jgi:hypothetical protein